MLKYSQPRERSSVDRMVSPRSRRRFARNSASASASDVTTMSRAASASLTRCQFGKTRTPPASRNTVSIRTVCTVSSGRPMTIAHEAAGSMTAAERARQRNAVNAVLAGFLGWTLDAFDFFILTLVIDDVATSFGRTRPDIAFALTVALACRPIGAVIFGIMADRLGRRLPLMINVIFYAVVSVLSGLAPNYAVFLGLRMLFGI